ncbi:MAG: hypothetical protein WC192_01955, partial [Candidatus Babeliales bacterium]
MKNNKSPFYLPIFLTTIACWNAQLFSSVENFVPNSAVVQTSPDRLKFDKTVFDNRNLNFFLGAAKDVDYPSTVTPPATSAKPYAITRVQGTSIWGITPEKISVPSDDGNSYTPEDNKLYGKRILNLGLFNSSYPLVSYQEDEIDTAKKDDSSTLFLINAYNDGKMNIATENPLNDSANQPTKQIKALTGSDTYVFAAVSATDQSWEEDGPDGENRGIAVVKPTLNAKIPTIKQIAAEDLSNNEPTETKAKILDVKAAYRPIVISFTEATSPTPAITKALIGAYVDMYWDSELKRLFVGLSGVHRDDPTNEGGCFSVLVGRIEKENIGTTSEKDHTLTFSSIVSSPTKKLFIDNSNKFMVGFYYDTTGAKDVTITAKKVRVMHTSTGYSYLISNCNLSGDGEYNKVFALPILGNKKPNGTTITDRGIIGTLSKIDDTTHLPTFDAIPTEAKYMPQFDKDNATDPSKTTVGLVVGQTEKDTGKLTDLFVQGDSVFICLSDDGSTQNSGIFESTALFNSDGFIIAWTPWQRVMGDVQKVFGGGVDMFNNFCFLTSQDTTKTDADTIRTSIWGTTETANQSETIDKDNGKPVWTKDTNRNLSALLSSIFPQEQVGVLQIINFDEYTPGFNQQKFSMMVAVGYDKVALIQTLDPTTQSPIKTFTTDGATPNVFVFQNDPVLKEIAPLCFAEVSRNTDGDTGWLFVGGYNGVAVLSQADGKGWDAKTGLINLGTEADNFPNPATYSFKKLTPSNGGNFSNIRKLASLVSHDSAGNDNIRKLFIQTKDNLYSIDQDKDKFKDVPDPLAEQEISTNLPATLKFTDLLIIPNSDTNADKKSNLFKFIFGSTYGLLVGSGYDGTKINLINSGSATSDPVLHLDYISKTKGLNSATGNLYALSANYLTNSGKIYRYSVNGVEPLTTNACKPISVDSNPFIDLHNFRGNFITDGAFGFSMIARGPSNNFLTDLYEIAQTQTETGSIDELLELNGTNWYIGVITRNTASGSWVVP